MRSLSLLQYAMLATLGGTLSCAHAEQIVFQNDLSRCMAIEATKTWADSNVVLANTVVQLHKPIGECGCTSALVTYTSSVDRGNARQALQEGVIGLKSGGEKTLVLATEPALVANKKVTIRLSCTGPL